MSTLAPHTNWPLKKIFHLEDMDQRPILFSCVALFVSIYVPFCALKCLNRLYVSFQEFGDKREYSCFNSKLINITLLTSKHGAHVAQLRN